MRTSRLIVVHEEQHVQVHRVDDDGSTGAAIGPAVLVTQHLAVMEVANREAMPSLPLRVLVPVAAGGGRDEQQSVTEVHLAQDGSARVALVLEAVEADPEGTAHSVSAGPGTGSRPDAPPWWCKVFPPACR